MKIITKNRWTEEYKEYKDVLRLRDGICKDTKILSFANGNMKILNLSQVDIVAIDV